MALTIEQIILLGQYPTLNSIRFAVSRSSTLTAADIARWEAANAERTRSQGAVSPAMPITNPFIPDVASLPAPGTIMAPSPTPATTPPVPFDYLNPFAGTPEVANTVATVEAAPPTPGSGSGPSATPAQIFEQLNTGLMRVSDAYMRLIVFFQARVQSEFPSKDALALLNANEVREGRPAFDPFAGQPVPAPPDDFVDPVVPDDDEDDEDDEDDPTDPRVWPPPPGTITDPPTLVAGQQPSAAFGQEDIFKRFLASSFFSPAMAAGAKNLQGQAQTQYALQHPMFEAGDAATGATPFGEFLKGGTPLTGADLQEKLANLGATLRAQEGIGLPLTNPDAIKLAEQFRKPEHAFAAFALQSLQETSPAFRVTLAQGQERAFDRFLQLNPGARASDVAALFGF